MAKKKLKPITVEDAMGMKIEHDDWVELSDRLRLPGTSKLALLELAKRTDLSYAVRSSIAESPNADEEVLISLSQQTSHRWEWRSISTRYCELYDAFLNSFNAEEPFGKQMTAGQFGTPSLAAAYLLHTKTTFAEDLWQDLGVRGLLELDYQVDTVEGDHFGPLHDENVGTDAGSAVEYLLTPGYACTWISREPQADLSYIIDVLSDGPAEEYLSECYYHDEENITGDSNSLVMGAVVGLSQGHLQISDEQLLGQLVTSWALENDEELLDQKVTISGAPFVVGARFQELSAQQIAAVIGNLRMAHAHPIMKNFGITHHLLSLVALHPHTPVDLRKEVLHELET